jgi:PAS domain S-box-containing protein
LSKKSRTSAQSQPNEIGGSLLVGERPDGEHPYVIESPTEAVVALDSAGRFTYINSCAVVLSGYSESEIIGKHFAEANLLTADSLPTATQDFANLLKGNPIRHTEFHVLTK